MPTSTRAVEPDRFWAKVQKTDGCWIWQGDRFAYGYGRIKVRPRTLLAHRVSWEIAHGPIPPGLFVCHHCDNPPCVNPAHLFLGTCDDNIRDRDRKGRGGWSAGSAHYLAKLSEPEVVAARYAYALSGCTQAALMRALGVSQPTASRLLTGTSYRGAR